MSADKAELKLIAKNNIVESIRNIWLLIRMMWLSHLAMSSFWAGLLLLSAGLPALQVWIQKESINIISLLPQNPILLKEAMVLIGVYFLSQFILNVLNQASTYIFTLIKEDVAYKLKVRLINIIILVPLSLFENSRFYDKVQLAKEALSRGSVDVVNHFFSIAKILLTLASLVILLASIHWVLPIALVLSALPGVVLLIITKKQRYKISVWNSPIGRLMEYTFRLLTSRDSAKEVRVFDLGKYLLNRWSDLFLKVRKVMLHQRMKENYYNLSGTFILQFVSLGASLLLISYIQDNKITIGDYVALSGAVSLVQGQLGQLAQSIGSIYENMLYINSYYDFQNLYSVKNDNKNIEYFPSEKNYNELRVEQLSFSYPEKSKPVLEDVTLSIKRGQNIAIVGENGAGKTTLVHCIMGLYQPTKGKVYVGDVDISKMDASSLREHFSAIFQDFIQYKYSFRENIGFGNIKTEWDDGKIIEFLEKVGLHYLVDRLPKGLDTLLGREFDKGQELSGGQWQRIAIARALFRDSDIIVLDEPTSSMDPKAELEIFNNFREMTIGKTTIMISHRLGPARYSDQIFVMKNGRIVEQGTHQELIEMGGEYANMYDAQAQWYQ